MCDGYSSIINEPLLSFSDIECSGFPLNPFPLSKCVRLGLMFLDLVVVTRWCVRVRILPQVVLVLVE